MKQTAIIKDSCVTVRVLRRDRYRGTLVRFPCSTKKWVKDSDLDPDNYGRIDLTPIEIILSI